MHPCMVCGETLHRVRRSWWQKLWYRSVYKCASCGAVEPTRREFDAFRISTSCHCPRCGRTELKTMRKRDPIENYQRGLSRVIQKWLGAKLYYCDRCRLQFYDLRRTTLKAGLTRANQS